MYTYQQSCKKTTRCQCRPGNRRAAWTGRAWSGSRTCRRWTWQSPGSPSSPTRAGRRGRRCARRPAGSAGRASGPSVRPTFRSFTNKTRWKCSTRKIASIAPVQDAKIRETDRQLLVAPTFCVEHKAVTGTVHGFQRELFLFHFKPAPKTLLNSGLIFRWEKTIPKHVVSIMLHVAGDFPKASVVDVGRNDLLEAPFPVLGTHQVDECVVNVGAFRVEKGRSGAKLVECEQLVLTTQFPVISSCCFFLHARNCYKTKNT